QIEPRSHLTIGVFGQTYRAGLRHPFESCCDIDAVAHQVAVGLLDHIAQMNPDAEVDAAIFRQPDVALDHAVLNLNCATHGVHHASELDNGAVASALHHAAVVYGNGRVDEVAAQRAEPRQCTVFVRANKPAEANDIGGQDRCEFSALGHGPLDRDADG